MTARDSITNCTTVAKIVLQLIVKMIAKMTLSVSSAESPAVRLRSRWLMARASMVVSSTATVAAQTPVEYIQNGDSIGAPSSRVSTGGRKQLAAGIEMKSRRKAAAMARMESGQSRSSLLMTAKVCAWPMMMMAVDTHRLRAPGWRTT